MLWQSCCELGRNPKTNVGLSLVVIHLRAKNAGSLWLAGGGLFSEAAVDVAGPLHGL